MGAAGRRRKAVGTVACLCLLSVFVSHTARVERWLHHHERWWSTSSSVSIVDAQRTAFSEAFYGALAERQASLAEDPATTAGAESLAAHPSDGTLTRLRDEIAREQKLLDEYVIGYQGLPTSAEYAVDDATMVTQTSEAQAAAAEQNACNAEQHRTGIDLIGGDIATGGRASRSSATSAEQCCQRCWSNRLRSGQIGCKAWTFDGGAGVCFLKAEPRGEAPAAPMIVSGYVPVSTRQSCPSSTERDYARDKFSAAIAQRSALSAQRGVDGGGIAWPHTDLVLVTAWGRPEFLLATMEHLLRAEGVQEHKFIFLLDDEFDLRMLCLIDAFPRHRGKVIVRTARHDWMWTKSWGNTYNTLEGYRYAEMVALGSHTKKRGESAESSAAELSCKLVYLVEEDIFVAADFFSFHRAVQSGHVAGLGPRVDAEHWGKVHSVMAHNLDVVGSPFLLDECYTALANPAETKDGHSALAGRLLYSMNHFASLGISFDYRNLSLITKHAVPSYYNNLVGYIAQKFPNAARKPNQAPEQDGLIDREYKDIGLRTVWPRCPRAMHAGFISSYHPSSMEGKGSHGNKLAGVSLQDRHGDLIRQMESELKARGTAFKDGQTVVVPTEGYWGGGQGGQGDLGLFYCEHFDTNQCPGCLGCCPCNQKGQGPDDGGPSYPGPGKFGATGGLGKVGSVLLSSQRSQIGGFVCKYDPPKDNCFISGCDLGESGCQAFPDLRTAQAVCSDNSECGGLTEHTGENGQRVFETRSGPAQGESPTGERCHVKIRVDGKCR